jgi:hypothetical protein
MKGVARIGTVGEERFVVSEQHLIDFAHDGMPEILCTLWLIWFPEHAARTVVPSRSSPKRARSFAEEKICAHGITTAENSWQAWG